MTKPRLVAKHAEWCKAGVTDSHGSHKFCLTCHGGVCPKCYPRAYADHSTPYIRRVKARKS